MSDLQFPYKGKDLVRPLTALLARLADDVTDLETEIGKQLPADVEAARAPTSLTARKQTQGEMRVRQLDSERLNLLVKRRETELFLAEARRLPRHIWSLTMRELAELYPLPKGVK